MKKSSNAPGSDPSELSWRNLLKFGALAQAVEGGRDRLTNAIEANVRFQVQQLLASSVVASAVNDGRLAVVGADYDLDTGIVRWFD